MATILTALPPPVLAMGCMRLSIEADRDDDCSVAVIHAALDAGVRLLDTADVYALDDADIGHNERLIARALREWQGGDAAAVVVATKGGLRRPGGRWIPDGRASHLRAACEASCRALGVDRIALYQLHAVDPRTPFATSVRALAALQRDGLVSAVGLCNVTRRQLDAAADIIEIAAVQVELSVWHDDALLNGVVEFCLERQMPLLAHRPLGGRKRRAQTGRDAALVDIAARHGVSPFDAALAAVRDLSPLIVPLPGPSRVETARAIARSVMTLTDADRDLLRGRIGLAIAAPAHTAASPPVLQTARGEVVLVAGLPAAGKSLLAETFVAQGYRRLNRDTAGGTLSDLLPALDDRLSADSGPVVLDNTYARRQARARVIRTARQHGRDVRCVWLDTSLGDAQVNAVQRIVRRYGRVLTPEELSAARAHDVAAFPPNVLFRYQRELEPPDASEGFSRVDVVPFVRQLDPSHRHRAVIVWCDDVLIRSRTGARAPVVPEDVEVPAARAAVLREWRARGWLVLGLAWRPEIAAGAAPAAAIEATFAAARLALGFELDVAYCPHAAGPPICWCRKPLPGLGVALIERYQLDSAHSLYVGEGTQDPGFARRLGLSFRPAGEFFSRESDDRQRRDLLLPQ